MPNLDCELEARLAGLREEGLYRELRQVDSAQSPEVVAGDRHLLNFSSNDYLGLANEPDLKEAAIRAVERYGAGAGASRLLCGSLAIHHTLDEALAEFKGTEAALSFSSGYAAALGALCAIVGKGDFVIIDKLVHACVIDAARLSGATLRVYRHNDLNSLEALLKWTQGCGAGGKPQAGQRRVLVVTESVFSMDGDHAPLCEIAKLKEKYGAWLMVDEAHATGLYGQQRRGLAQELGVCGQIELQMGTLGKALGSAGGFICGSRTLADYLLNRARSFIFSTAPVPAAAGAAIAGIKLVESLKGEERRRRLWERVTQTTSGLRHRPARPSAILPLLIGDEGKAVATAAALRELGLLIPAVRYPTVPRGSARLRLTLSAAHSEDHIARLLTALNRLELSIIHDFCTHASPG
jgi:8-amino-7-oxononanoate synthase